MAVTQLSLLAAEGEGANAKDRELSGYPLDQGLPQGRSPVVGPGSCKQWQRQRLSVGAAAHSCNPCFGSSLVVPEEPSPASRTGFALAVFL